MTVSQSRTVDWLGLEKETGHVVLTVVDDLDWSNEPEHISLLQEKLNTYLAFMESGEVFDRLLEDMGQQIPRTTPLKVSILAQFALSLGARKFFEYAKATFAGAGFTLTFKLITAPS